MKYWNVLSGAAAMLALSQSQVAMAQASANSCIKQADLADAVVFAMPSLISAFRAKCGPSLPANGFIGTQGSKLAASYTALQPAAWPGARRFLLGFAQNNTTRQDDGMATMLATLPAEAVRPFVDALIQQEVSKEIPIKDCSNIERGVSLLAPLPPQNMGGLTVFLLRMAYVKKPNICESD
jgi:hypothetical protein